MKTCPCCKGSGVTTVTTQNFEEIQWICQACNGTGLVNE